ncbi:MAG: AFG1/ZapE family ATPase [Hyphomicrobium sp.]
MIFAISARRRWGTVDYLRIAHTYHTLLIDGIPVMARERRDAVRRFINLVDTLYDNKVCLIASAAAEPDAPVPR